jgi:hypothetical protein
MGGEAMMDQRNGFVSFFVLWLGLAILFLTATTAAMAELYLQQACRYRDHVSTTYLAESALLVGWDGLQQAPWEDIPTRREQNLEDTYGLTEKNQSMRLQYNIEKQIPPYRGTLMAIGAARAGQITRTCSLTFYLEPGEEGVALPTFTIRKCSY